MNKDKQIFMKTALSVLALLGMTLLLASCAGNSSDPLKGYNVKGVPVSKDNVSKTQDFCTRPYDISVSSNDKGNVGQFSEGKSGSIKIHVTSLNSSVGATKLSISDFPFANPPEPTALSEAGDSSITWTPVPGTVGTDSSGGVSQLFNIHAMAVSGPCEGFETVQQVPLVVNRSNEAPRITNIDFKGADKKASEGQKLAFTITVVDPNYHQGLSLPELDPVPVHYTKTEAYVGDAAPFINDEIKFLNSDSQSVEIASTVEAKGNNTFVFHKVLDLSKLPAAYSRIAGQIDVNKEKILMCFSMRPISSNNTPGIKVPHCVEASYAAQSAEISMITQDMTAIAGVQKTIQFKMSTSNNLSKLEIKNPSSQLSSLSGNSKELSCVDQLCTLTWTPPCGQRYIKKYPLHLVVSSTYQDKSAKQTNIDQEIDVSSADASCTAAATPSATPAVTTKKQQTKTTQTESGK